MAMTGTVADCVRLEVTRPRAGGAPWPGYAQSPVHGDVWVGPARRRSAATPGSKAHANIVTDRQIHGTKYSYPALRTQVCIDAATPTLTPVTQAVTMTTIQATLVPPRTRGSNRK